MHKHSLLTDNEIITLYLANESLHDICKKAQVSRQAIYNTLKRNGIVTKRRRICVLKCMFCGEMFERKKSHIKTENNGFCSQECFHASRSQWGIFSATETFVSDRQQGRRALKALILNGVPLQPGQVIHHIDGNRTNSNVENLMIFNSHSEHMQYHHSLKQSNVTKLIIVDEYKR